MKNRMLKIQKNIKLQPVYSDQVHIG